MQDNRWRPSDYSMSEFVMLCSSFDKDNSYKTSKNTHVIVNLNQ